MLGVDGRTGSGAVPRAYWRVRSQRIAVVVGYDRDPSFFASLKGCGMLSRVISLVPPLPGRPSSFPKIIARYPLSRLCSPRTEETCSRGSRRWDRDNRDRSARWHRPRGSRGTCSRTPGGTISVMLDSDSDGAPRSGDLHPLAGRDSARLGVERIDIHRGVGVELVYPGDAMHPRMHVHGETGAGSKHKGVFPRYVGRGNGALSRLPVKGKGVQAGLLQYEGGKLHLAGRGGES